MTRALTAVVAALACAVAACGGSTGPACGPTTRSEQGRCLPAVMCGPGTEARDGACVPTTPCESTDCEAVSRSYAINARAIEAANAADYTAALAGFEEAVAIYPDNHEAWYGHGHMRGQQRRWDEALISFERAVALRPDTAMYQLWVGIAYFETGDAERAATHLADAIRIAPEMFRAHWYLGRAQRDLGRPAEAAAAWTRACALNPEYGPSFLRLAELYLTFDHVDEAVAVLVQGAAGVRDERDAGNIHYYLGLAYDAQQRWTDAVAAYTRVLELDPGNVDALFQRGMSHMSNGNKAAARADLEAFLANGDAPFERAAANQALMELLRK